MKPIKSLIFLSIATILLSCSTDPTTKSEASILQTANAQGNGPNKLTAEDVQLMIDKALKTVYGNSNTELDSIYYSRRETLEDDFDHIRFLEEINSEDYQIQVSRGGKGSFFWMDDNIGNSNIVFDINEDGGYSSIRMNNKFLIFNQDKGVYHFNTLKKFDSNDEAKSYFEANGWNKRNTIYMASDGTLKATY